MEDTEKSRCRANGLDWKAIYFLLLPFWPEEAENWLEPHDSVQRQPHSLVAVAEGVLEVHQRQNSAAGGEEDGHSLHAKSNSVGLPDDVLSSDAQETKETCEMAWQ